MIEASPEHIPVMAGEVRDLFDRPPGRVLDATGGAGGHTAILLDLGHRVVTLDRDPEAVAFLRRRFDGISSDRLLILNRSYSRIGDLGEFDGFLADLGFSSRQLAQQGRGFSFRADGPLDMRMDPAAGATAAELIRDLPAKELASIFRKFGEEKFATRIAKGISGRSFSTAKELGEEIEAIVGVSRGKRAIHPATRVFQALRIAVNDELGELSRLLAQVPRVALAGARVAFIAFHSLEDRLVKEAMQMWEGRCVCPPGLPVCACGAKSLGRRLWNGVKHAEESEVSRNPRARSARMRAFCFRETKD